jgi:multidrug efflux pump subunit AcrA (membrane-fusion protein)
MKLPSLNGRTLTLVGVLGTLVALFVHVALRSGPLAPVPVTVAVAENLAITPALFSIGTIEGRYTFRIGRTIAGRIKRVDVNVGDRVQAGQLPGEMDPVDLDDRVAALEASIKRGGHRAGGGSADPGRTSRWSFSPTNPRHRSTASGRSLSSAS